MRDWIVAGSNDTWHVDRRRFLRTAALAATAGGILQGWPRLALGEPMEDAARLVAGKDRRLIVHSREPLELETPLELLREHAITPKSLVFVRNNQALDGTSTTAPVEDSAWSIDVGGLVEFPRRITVGELARMDQVEHELVLQCSGNGRSFFSQAAEAKGSQWQHGAMANVRFKGVPLRAVLERLKLNVDPAARFLTAEGRDAPIKGDAADFEHSIPLRDALEKSILALQMDGEPIPGVHGGPVRLVTPGYYGTMNVKWLGRLRLEANETANHHQIKRYRTPIASIEPGAKFEYGADNSEPNWGMRIKSVIFAPLNGQRVPPGKVDVRGVAWNDGTVRITAVEVSSDAGRSWRRAELKVPNSPYAWYQWSIGVDLPRGEHVLQARAIDALGRSQPIDGAVHWNPAGYAWNGVHRIAVTAG